MNGGRLAMVGGLVSLVLLLLANAGGLPQSAEEGGLAQEKTKDVDAGGPADLADELKKHDQKMRQLTVKLIPDAKSIEMRFPVGAVEWETAWKVNWTMDDYETDRGKKPLFCIKEAWFKTSPQAPWLQVLGDARVSETFTAYQDGATRYADMKQGIGYFMTLTPKDVGPRGLVLKASDPRVAAEIRDRGILWALDKPGNVGEMKTHHSQELVLWASMKADNYFYLMEYAFRDDGSVGCRAGATGHNLYNQAGAMPKKHNYPSMAHIHNVCWHLNVDLGGKGDNTVYLVRQVENKIVSGGKGEPEELFNGGLEGTSDWKPLEFTSLRIKHKPAKGMTDVAYDLLPQRTGTARSHFQADVPNKGDAGSEFTAHDFWVTPYDKNKLVYYHLPTYLQKNPARNIKNENVSIWYMASYRHEPRPEDGHLDPKGQPLASAPGVALTAWMGFELRPRGVFQGTPFLGKHDK